MGIVQWILECGDGFPLSVTDSYMSHITIWLVLKHPRFCDYCLHLLEHAPEYRGSSDDTFLNASYSISDQLVRCVTCDLLISFGRCLADEPRSA